MSEDRPTMFETGDVFVNVNTGNLWAVMTVSPNSDRRDTIYKIMRLDDGISRPAFHYGLMNPRDWRKL
jgi:hypothetical protein